MVRSRFLSSIIHIAARLSPKDRDFLVDWDTLFLMLAARPPNYIGVSHALISSVYSGDDSFVVISVAISINASTVIPIILVIPVPVAGARSIQMTSIIFSWFSMSAVA